VEGVFRRYLEVERVSLLTGEDEGGNTSITQVAT
jgi:hypothetical protein